MPGVADDSTPWKALYDNFEKVVAPPMEEMFRSDDFGDILAAIVKSQREARERNELASKQFWRDLNLPSAHDVDRLTRQVATLERLVRDLHRRLDSLLDDADGA